MQSTLQHADPQSDPHDEIVALLRRHAPRIAKDPSVLNIAPADRDRDTPSSAPSVDQQLRAALLNDNVGNIREPAPRARRGRRVARVLLTVFAGVAATIAWQAYGEDAKQGLSSLAPQLFAGAPAPTQSANATEPQDAASQAAAPETAAEAAPAQAAAAAPAAETAPAQATLSPELAQSIESMAREIASLKQTVEQLKAGQQQLSRDVAKAAEQETRRKLAAQTPKPASPPQPQRASTPPPHAAAAPRAPYPPPQTYPQGQAYPQGAMPRDAYIPPPPPARLPPEPGFASAPRPPMPLQ